MKGQLYNLGRDLDGKLIASFLVFDEKSARKELDAVKDEKMLEITAKKIRKKRSMSANAYYWVLVGKLAGLMRISTARCHNILLRRYGTPQTFDGEQMYVMIPDTDKAFDEALESETYHLAPTSSVREKRSGEMYRVYRILKGSSEYDSVEMTRLINGLVDECKGVGIETLTPREIEEMLSEVRRREKKHNPSG